jgi:hypothetical protein
MSQGSSPQIQVLPTGGYVSTLFVFNSVDYQRSAAAAYVAKSTADAVYISSGNTENIRKNFKTYDEKTKYLIGRLAATQQYIQR